MQCESVQKKQTLLELGHVRVKPVRMASKQGRRNPKSDFKKDSITECAPLLQVQGAFRSRSVHVYHCRCLSSTVVLIAITKHPIKDTWHDIWELRCVDLAWSPIPTQKFSLNLPIMQRRWPIFGYSWGCQEWAGNGGHFQAISVKGHHPSTTCWILLHTDGIQISTIWCVIQVALLSLLKTIMNSYTYVRVIRR